MFMQIAIGAIGIGVVLMIGYVVVSQVRSVLPTSASVQVQNPCLKHYLNDTTFCNMTSYSSSVYGSIPGPIVDNHSAIITVVNTGATTGTASAAVTVYAGFGLIAVGIIVLAAFGLINIFK